MFTACKNAVYFVLFIVFNNFLVMDTDLLLALALETCATIPPDVDAIFSTLEINVHFCIIFIAKFEFLKLHSKVCLFERMLEFNQVYLGPSL